MSEDFGPTFITVTDEDGKEIVLEFVDALEHNGQMYQAFFPAETEDEEEDPDSGLVILKVIHEDGEDLLSTLDTEEELEGRLRAVHGTALCRRGVKTLKIPDQQSVWGGKFKKSPAGAQRSGSGWKKAEQRNN